MPSVAGLSERPGDEKIAVGRIVVVRNMGHLRSPAPCGETVTPNQQVALRPLPDRLERRPIVKAFRNQHGIALPLAVADVAIGIIDDASFRCHEPLLVLTPGVHKRGGRAARAECCGGAERCKQRHDQDHHSHITFFPARGQDASLPAIAAITSVNRNFAGRIWYRPENSLRMIASLREGVVSNVTSKVSLPSFDTRAVSGSLTPCNRRTMAAPSGAAARPLNMAHEVERTST